MPAKVYSDKDADLKHLHGKTLAVLGFGSQGHAHALNLKDSGCQVIIGLYEGSKSTPVARSHGFEVFSTAEAVRRADVIFVAIPDTKQARAYENDIAPNLAPGKTLLFSHGFSIHFKTIVPPKDVNVILVAPKGPGHIVRRQYLEGKGVPALIGVYQDPGRHSKAIALAGPASSRPASKRKPRPICSANKPSCAAAHPPSSWPDTKRWSKPATSRRWPISNACTS
jgi:ketol-acid reductoisomerase